MDNLVYASWDADAAGRKIGQAILGDNPEDLKDASERIDLGNQLMVRWCQKWQGLQYSSGGDQGLVAIPEDAVAELESLRQDYRRLTGLTLSMGVGKTLSESGRALLVSKARGKDRITVFDDSVEAEIRAITNRVAQGQGSEEERKLSEVYIAPADGERPLPPESQAHQPVITTEASFPSPETRSSQPEIHTPGQDVALDPDPPSQTPEAPVMDVKTQARQAAEKSNHHAPVDRPGMKAIVAQIEAEGSQDGPSQNDADVMDHIDDTDLAVGTATEAGTSRPTDFKEQNEPGDMGIAEASPSSTPESEDEVSAPEPTNPVTDPETDPVTQAVQDPVDPSGEVAETPENVEAEQSEAAALNGDVDAAIDDVLNADDSGDQAIDDVLNANNAGDEAIDDVLEGQDGVDMADVLRDGLDSHADDIQRDRIKQMIGEALEGFKAHKQILERAKEHAPEYYNSSIAMLRAMIEMCHLLGLGDDSSAPGVSEEEAVIPDQATAPAATEAAPVAAQPAAPKPAAAKPTGEKKPEPKKDGQFPKPTGE